MRARSIAAKYTVQYRHPSRNEVDYSESVLHLGLVIDVLMERTGLYFDSIVCDVSHR